MQPRAQVLGGGDFFCSTACTAELLLFVWGTYMTLYLGTTTVNSRLW